MTIRRKVFLLTLLAITALVAVNLLVGIQSLLRIIRAQDLEYAMLREKSYRILLEQSGNRIDTVVYDWCAWDELYRYATGDDDTFPELYMTDEAVAAMRFDALILVSPDGSVRAANTIGFDDRPAALATFSTLSVVDSLVQSGRYESRIGYVLHDGRLYLASASSVSNTDMTAPTCGVLIGVREILKEIPQALLDGTVLSLETAAPETETVQLESEATMSFSLHLRAEGFGEGGTMKVTIPRQHNLEAHSAGAIGIIAVAASSVIIYMILMSLLSQSILKPVAAISAFMRQVSADQIPEQPLPETNHDEIGHLAADINKTMARIASDGRRMTELNLFLRTALDASGAGSIEIDLDSGRVRLGPSSRKMFGWTGDEECDIGDLVAFTNSPDLEGMFETGQQISENWENQEFLLLVHPEKPEERWLHVRCSISPGHASADKRRMIGLVFDHTENVLRERALA